MLVEYAHAQNVYYVKLRSHARKTPQKLAAGLQPVAARHHASLLKIACVRSYCYKYIVR